MVGSVFDMIDIKEEKKKLQREKGIATSEVRSYQEMQKGKKEERVIFAKARQGMKKEEEENYKKFKREAKKVSGFLTKPRRGLRFSKGKKIFR